MFGDLIYTDDKKSKPAPKGLLGKIKDEFLVHFNQEHGVWLQWSADFVDIFSVPKEYRASMFGQFALSPEEAMDEFLEDEAPSAKRLQKAQLAMMSRWKDIGSDKKKRFLSHYKKLFGMNTLFCLPGSMFFNLAMMLLLVDDEDFDSDDQDEYSDLLLLAILSGMDNQGPTALQDMVKSLTYDNEGFQEATAYLQGRTEAGWSLAEMHEEVENRMDKHQVKMRLRF